MTGCYLLHGYDFENAVYLISSLAKVKGTAIPVTLGNYYLGAELADGTKVYGQANVTRQNDRYDSPIRRLFFVKNRQAGANELRVEANERAVSALREADLIVYSIGSFYTSILCTLLTHGILDAIKQSNAPKIFLANAVADDETKGLSLSHMLTAFNHCCQSIGDAPRVLTDYIHYVIANDHGNSSIYRGRGGYIPVDQTNIIKCGVSLLEYPLEKNRGVYDTDLISRIILSFVHL